MPWDAKILNPSVPAAVKRTHAGGSDKSRETMKTGTLGESPDGAGGPVFSSISQERKPGTPARARPSNSLRGRPDRWKEVRL
jgi:hypothetical protein